MNRPEKLPPQALKIVVQALADHVDPMTIEYRAKHLARAMWSRQTAERFVIGEMQYLISVCDSLEHACVAMTSLARSYSHVVSIMADQAEYEDSLAYQYQDYSSPDGE